MMLDIHWTIGTLQIVRILILAPDDEDTQWSIYFALFNKIMWDTYGR